jgi:NADH-ubiquinone oxidoreductase chain 6
MTNNLFFSTELVTNNFNITILGILSALAILFAGLVIITKNPIFSVLYLIGLFLSIAGYLCAIGLEFIGLAYLLVYVGAVSILFLFILMLINIRASELLSETYKSIPLVIMVACSLMAVLGDALNYVNDPNSLVLKTIFTQSWDNILSANTHITAIGNILYSNVSIWLIVTSIILLLAMVGAIVITLKPIKNVEDKYLNSIPVHMPIMESVVGDIADTAATLGVVAELLSQAADHMSQRNPQDLVEAVDCTRTAGGAVVEALTNSAAAGCHAANMASQAAYPHVADAQAAVYGTANMVSAMTSGAPIDPSQAAAASMAAADVCQHSANVVNQAAEYLGNNN